MTRPEAEDENPVIARVFAVGDALPPHPPAVDIVLSAVMLQYRPKLSDILSESLEEGKTDAEKVSLISGWFDALINNGGRGRKFALLWLYGMVAGFSIDTRVMCKRNAGGLPLAEPKPMSPLEEWLIPRVWSLTQRRDLDKVDHEILAAASRQEMSVLEPVPPGTTTVDEARRAGAEVFTLFQRAQSAFAPEPSSGPSAAGSKKMPTNGIETEAGAGRADPTPRRKFFHLDDATGVVRYRNEIIFTLTSLRKRHMLRALLDTAQFSGDKELFSHLSQVAPAVWTVQLYPRKIEGERTRKENKGARSLATDYTALDDQLTKAVNGTHQRSGAPTVAHVLVRASRVKAFAHSD